MKKHLFFVLLAIACVTKAAEVELVLPVTDKVTIISCFVRQGNFFSGHKGITEKDLGENASLAQTFREQLAKNITNLGYNVIVPKLVDVCPVKDGMTEPDGVAVVIIIRAIGRPPLEDAILAQGFIKVPNQPKLISEYGQWLNTYKGVEPGKAAQEAATKLVERIRTAQKTISEKP